MKEIIILLILSFLILTFTGCGVQRKPQEPVSFEINMPNKDLRPASAAGKFYSASGDILEKEINVFLAENNFQSEEDVFALMVPHAGYIYAGRVFGSAYSTIKDKPIKTVIIIGNSHHAYFDGISVYSKGAYETPLGEVAIDTNIAKAIMLKDKKFVFNPKIHETEHSIEVQLPFLQIALRDFKIVPLLMGNDLMDTCQLLANVLKDVIGNQKNVLLIASSDMSHYPPYENANQVDKEVLDMIQKGDAKDLEKLLEELEVRGIPRAVSFLCGSGAVKTIMLLAKEAGANNIKILKYANSGDVINDKSGVVGYGAVSFSFPSDVSEEKEDYAVKDSETENISEQDKKELLKLAKMSVEAKVKGEPLPEFQTTSPALKSQQGAFVTLKKDGNLRGCIGRFISKEPLYKVVQDMAVEAATSDSRFMPISLNELPELEYEISILSPLERIFDPYKDIELGKHGVQVRQGIKSGVFLPQVATESGWDFETFMNQLCEHKAGIPRDAWKKGSAEIYRFTAGIVSE